MARIVVGSYMVRYPLGGMLSWGLQYLLGFRDLDHEVFVVEKAHYPNACFDPVKKVMKDDGSRGFSVVKSLLNRFGMVDNLCFIDYSGQHLGMTAATVQRIFDSADLFVDMGTHGSMLDKASRTGRRVLIDGEPGFTQMKMVNRRNAGEEPPVYDAYYTNGLNIGTSRSTAPTVGIDWKHLLNPVATDYLQRVPAVSDSPFTTVMNWQSHTTLTYNGSEFGQKDIEFAKFIDLPVRQKARIEVAVAGANVPRDRLLAASWQVRDAHEVTSTFDSFNTYIQTSRGEFSVCKNVFVATNSGWTSDRSAAYLASARPVILQDTGFSELLPTGEGLFAFSTLDEAVAAIEAVESNYERHCKAAREIAEEYFDARKVLSKLLDDVLT